jgi:hypothetical protein
MSSESALELRFSVSVFGGDGPNQAVQIVLDAFHARIGRFDVGTDGLHKLTESFSLDPLRLYDAALGLYDQCQFVLDAFESLLRCHIPSVTCSNRTIITRPFILAWLHLGRCNSHQSSGSARLNGIHSLRYATCKSWRASAYAIAMPKKPPKQIEIPKVVPLTEEKRQVIATDQKSQRIIVGIGQQRIAFDLFTRVTRLPSHTGDQPAPVVTMKRKRK